MGWAFKALAWVVGISVVGGVVAAVAGGSLSDLGSGYGGLYGFPAMLLTLVALVVGVAAVVVVIRRLKPGSGRLRVAAVVLVGLWVVAVGYGEVAHAVDPCANGWWDARSRIGSQPLCERFGAELNWHTRFHLVAHAVPAAVLVGGYAYVLRRWGQPGTVDDSQS